MVVLKTLFVNSNKAKFRERNRLLKAPVSVRLGGREKGESGALHPAYCIKCHFKVVRFIKSHVIIMITALTDDDYQIKCQHGTFLPEIIQMMI